LQRLSGVFAPRSRLRAAVIPRGPVARAFATPTKPRAKKKKKKKRTPTPPDNASPRGASAEGTSREGGRASENAAARGPRTSLGDGVVRPGGSRIEWAQLLRRTYLVDVLACPCGGRRVIVSDISEREVIVAILAHLGLPTEAPPVARARSPAFELS
jgi:hypothetical protein